MALHIILVLLFQQKTNSVIHIPGKFIPTMISFLSDHVPRKEHVKLVECQRLISAKWKSSLAQGSEETGVVAETEENAAQEVGTQSSDDSETAIQTLIQELQCLVQ